MVNKMIVAEGKGKEVMASLAQKQKELSEQEEQLYRELDKGLDDMEQGRTISHDEAMKQIRERIKSYAL